MLARFINKTTLLMKTIFFFLLFSSVALGQTSPSKPKLISNEIKIVGEVSAPQTLSLESFSAFNAADLPTTIVRNHKGDSISLATSYRGVLLKDLLERAKIKMSNVREASDLIVIAKAPDGYLVTYSCHELFNTPVGDSVFVLFERDGKPIEAESGGRFRMMSFKDFKNGARHFKWLSEIEVRKIQR